MANVGHGLGDKKQAVNALSAFFAMNLAEESLPVCSWAVKEKRNRIYLNIHSTPDQLVGATLWTSTANSRDFREAVWNSQKIKLSKRDKSKVQVKLKYPKDGLRAFYVDLIYRDNRGKEYSISTRAFVVDTKVVSR